MAEAIALIDANNFYAACEQSFDPSLVNRPLVILSNNDGCVIARSPEARELGIMMGQPYFKIRNKLKRLNVEVRSSNYSLYGDMSYRLMSLIKSHCQEIEVYSIDEAFVKIKRPPSQNLRPWAATLRALIYQNLGLPIAIGIGTSKGQAKAANYLAKTMSVQAGIFDMVIEKKIDLWLESIPIEKVWGIGRKLTSWCRSHGVNNARQLRDMPSHELHGKCGVTGMRIQLELRGEICLPLVSKPTLKKETRVSRSFGRPVHSPKELRQAIAIHVIRAAEKLRKANQLAGEVSIFTTTSPFAPNFYSKLATTKLQAPSNSTNTLLAIALKLTAQIYKPNTALVKAGVIMRRLQSAEKTQGLLLSTSPEFEKNKKLMKTIDTLNERYGSNTISWGAYSSNHAGKMRQEYLSPRSTTRLDEIPIVKS